MLIPEISPQRSRAWGRPAIHWHFLALCKGSRWSKDWWLSIAEWNDIYKRAFLWHCKHEAVDTRASVRCVMARNPARYLSKYLSKQTGVIESCDYESHQDALPRQWQSRSDPMRSLVRFYTGRLPSSFAEFLDKEYAVLEGMNLGFARHWHPPSCDRYQVLSFFPNSLESLMLTWERYMSWLGGPNSSVRLELSDEIVTSSFASVPVKSQDQTCGPVVANGIRPLNNLITPNTHQLDFIKMRLGKAEVVMGGM